MLKPYALHHRDVEVLTIIRCLSNQLLCGDYVRRQVRLAIVHIDGTLSIVMAGYSCAQLFIIPLHFTNLVDDFLSGLFSCLFRQWYPVLSLKDTDPERAHAVQVKERHSVR